jgi:DNA polymerase-1
MVKAKRPKLILIDGHSLAYRAYFAMINTPLSIDKPNGEKELTGAVFAFSNMLLKVWKDEQPDYIAVAFDVGRTFRDDLYADYKGTREKMPDELNAQLTRIQQVVNTFDIPIFTAQGYEADDVLGTLARRASGEGYNVVIVTGDRDALQLVSPAVTVLTSKQRFEDTIAYDEAKVEEVYGVKPAQIIDYKAMLGDTSDNVPGVKGIGEKSAQSLLQQFGTLDQVYAHLDDITQKRSRTALEAGKESAYLSKQLVTIKTDVPLEVNWEACAAQFDYQRVLGLFRELRFESLIKRIPQMGEAVAAKADEPAGQLGMFRADEAPTSVEPLSTTSQVPTKTHLVDSDEAYKALLSALNSAKHISFDTETTSTDPISGEVVGISLSVGDGEGWYVPVAPSGRTAQPAMAPSTDGAQGELSLGFAPTSPAVDTNAWQLDASSPKFEPLVRALQRKDVRLSAHNAKFDLEALRQLGITIDQRVFDTMIAQFLIDPGGRALGLKQLAFNYFGWQMTEITELIGKGKKQITMRDVPIAQVAPYAAADADATFRLQEVLAPKLIERNQQKLFDEVELPLIPVLVDMELAGVAVDINYLGELGGELTERMRKLEKEIYALAGSPVNINSPKQLSDLLFGKLGLPTQGAWKTNSGGFSTSADILEELKDKHEIVALILDHRELSKLQGTYVDALPRMINPHTGRIHTDFNQTGAVTGRISSSNPNLQNIPIKSELGRRVRKAFVPRKGWRLISADYSQVELRILADMADDPTMKAAFKRDEDIHATTASVIYNVTLGDVNAMQRNNAKRINFGIAYGMGAFALAANTGMSVGEAQDFINKYFERFPQVKAWLEATKRKAADVGYVETVLGRRRYFPELQSKGGGMEQQRRRAEREAINHPVQGSAADIMKIAMINIHKALKQGNYQTRMTLQVHDELVFDAPPNELAEVKALISKEMEAAYPLSVHLKAEVKDGKNWDEA